MKASKVGRVIFVQGLKQAAKIDKKFIPMTMVLPQTEVLISRPKSNDKKPKKKLESH